MNGPDSRHHSYASMPNVLFDYVCVLNEKARLLSGAHLLRRRGREIAAAGIDAQNLRHLHLSKIFCIIPRILDYVH